MVSTLVFGESNRSTLWKTVSARIRGAKTELQELGEDTDDLANGFSKYREELLSLTGVDVQSDENHYRDLYDIFVDLASVWDDLESDMARARVAEILGGTRNQSGIMSAITNIKDAIGAYESAMDSAGTAMNANNIVMDTTEKHIQQLKVAWQELSFNTMNSDMMKFFVDLAASVVNAVNAIGPLKAAMAGLAGAKLFQLLKAGSLFNQITSGVGIIQKLTTGFQMLAASVGLSAPALAAFIGIAAGLAAFKAYTGHVESLRKAADEAASSFSESTSGLAEQAAKIRELREQLASGTLSETEAYNARKSLLEIQNQLAESYGVEAASIDLVNGKLDEQIAKVLELSSVEAEAFLNNEHSSIKKATEEMEKVRDEFLGEISPADTDLINLLEGYSGRGVSLTDTGNGTLAARIKGTASELSSVLGDIQTDLRNTFGEDLGAYDAWYGHVGTAAEELFDTISDRAKSANKVLSDWQNIYEQAQMARMVSDKSEYRADNGEQQTAIKWLNDYAVAVENYNNALESGDAAEISKARASWLALDNTLKALTTGQMSEYASQYEELRSALNETKIANDEFVDSLKTGGKTDADKTLSQYAQVLKDTKMTVTDASNMYLFGDPDNNKEQSDAVHNLIDAYLELNGIETRTPEDIESAAQSLANAGVLIDNAVSDIGEGTAKAFSFADIVDSDSDFNKALDGYLSDLDKLKDAREKALSGDLTERELFDLKREYKDLQGFDLSNIDAGLTLAMRRIIGETHETSTEFDDFKNNVIDGSVQLKDAFSEIEGITDKEFMSAALGGSGRFADEVNLLLDAAIKSGVIDNSEKGLQAFCDSLIRYGLVQGEVSDVTLESTGIIGLFDQAIQQAGSDTKLVEYLTEMKNGVQDFVDITGTDSTEKFKGTIEDFYDLIGDSTFNDGITNITDKIGKVQDALDSMEAGEFEDTDLYKLAREIGHPELLTNMDDVEGSLRNLKEQFISGGADVEGNASLFGYFAESIQALRDAGSDEAAAQLENLYQIIANGVEETVDAKSAFDSLGETLATFSTYQSTVTSALEHSMSATGLTTEEIQELTKAYEGVEGFDPARLFEHTFNGIHLNRQELERLNAEIKSSTLQKLYDDLNAKKRELAEAPLGSDTTGLENDIAQAELLISSYEGMTSAYNAWLQAKSAGDERDSYASVGEGQKQVEELLKQGWVEDAEVNEWLDLVLAESERTGDNIADYEKVMSNYEGKDFGFTDLWHYNEDNVLDPDGLQLAVDYLHEMDDSLVQVQENADGSLAYDIDLTGDKLQRAADILHTTPEMVELLGRALLDVNKNVKLGGDAIEKDYVGRLAEVNAQLKEAQENSSNTEVTSETGEVEVSSPTTSVEWDNAVTAAQEGMQRIRSIIQEAQSANPEIDVTTVVEGEEEVTQIAEQLSALPPEIQTEVGIETPGDVDGIIAQLTNADESVDVTANYKKGEQEEPEEKSTDVNYEKGSQEEPDDKNATVNYTKGTQEMPTSPVHVSVIYDGLKTTLPTLTQRVTVVREETKASGTFSPTRAYANGTAYNVLNLRRAYANGQVALQQDEVALVNELGTESIIRNGNWYLLPNGMHRQALKKGDIVLSARQTKALINTGAAPGHGRAYASGTFLSHAHANDNDIQNHAVTATNLTFRKLGQTGGSTVVDTGGGDAYVTYGDNYGGGGSGDGGGGSGSGGGQTEEKTALETFQDWISQFFDWVEVKLERVTTRIERFVGRAESAVDREAWGTASKNYRKAIKTTASLTDYERQANAKYKSQAQTIMDRAIADGLISEEDAKEIIKLDKSGKIDIDEYGEEIQEVVKDYQEWMDKAREASQSLEELHNNIREYTKSLKEVRDAQRDARLERLDDRDSIGAGGLANNLSFANRQLRYQQSLNRQRTAAYTTATRGTSSDVNRLASSATTKLREASKRSAVKEVPKKEREGYRKALREAKAAVKAKKPIPSSALKVIRKYNIEAYNRAYAYNVSLENLEDARYEEAINYSEVSAENFKNTAEIYDNLDQKTQDAMDLNQQRSDNAKTAAGANKYLNDVAKGYDQTIKNDTKEIKNYNDKVKRNKKTIKNNAGTTNTGKDRKKVTQAVESAKKQAKSGKTIAPSVLAKLAEYYSNGFVTYAFYKACVDYNNALDSKRDAEAQIEVDKQTAKAEKAAIGEQRVANVEEAFNRKLERQEAAASLYNAQNNYRTTRGISLGRGDIQRLADNNIGQQNITRNTISRLESTIAENVRRGYWTVNSPEYYEAMTNLTNWRTKLVDLQTEQEELNNQIVQLPFDKYEKALEKLDAIAERIESEVDLKSARGEDLSAADYQSRINNNLSQYQQYLNLRSQAYDNYLTALAASDKVYGGKSADEWYNMYNQYSADANGVLADNEKLKDSLRDDVYWRAFERAHDAAQRFKDTLDGINDLLDENMFFDKDGNLTQWGVDHVSNLVKQLETLRTDTQNYTNDLRNLNKLYAQGMYTDLEYEEKKAEIVNGMLSAAADTKGVMDEIVDFYKDIDQHELDALMKLIDLRNEALSKKKACINAPFMLIAGTP